MLSGFLYFFILHYICQIAEGQLLRGRMTSIMCLASLYSHLLYRGMSNNRGLYMCSGLDVFCSAKFHEFAQTTLVTCAKTQSPFLQSHIVISGLQSYSSTCECSQNGSHAYLMAPGGWWSSFPWHEP